MNIKLKMTHISYLINFSKQTMVLLLALSCGYSSAAVNNSVSVANFTKVPSLLATSTTPQVMLAMSNDHQLYKKLYNDWEDIDQDGTPDTTYDHSFDYYGYFDAYKCYSYSTGDGRFAPQSVTETKYCDGTTYSGNFLNWASMTRMDAVRKVFYGGYRSTDSSSLTVLERAYLPMDIHSFAKYFADDGDVTITKLTPFTANEITICNTTLTTGLAKDETNSPLMRIAEGKWITHGAQASWSAGEVAQCHWKEERDNGSSPSRDDGINHGGGTADYNVRIEVCNSSLRGSENCKTYGSSNKPIGLLQSYGDTGAIDFGLITGSYAKNKTGGVIRKNISSFTDEVQSTDGTFLLPTDSIISTLDKLRISQWNRSDYKYANCLGPGKDLSTESDGVCPDWGNPYSEIYLEAVRYFAGLSKTSDYDVDDTSWISGLTDVSSWSDPLSHPNRCASCNIVMINASEMSYDADNLSMAGLPGLSATSHQDLTDSVGSTEGISGDYFVGEASAGGSSEDQQCTPKAVTDLSDVRGTCPDAPRLGGSYNVAGMAHWAHTEDIRTDLDDMQLVNSYAIALAPTSPSITIPDPDNTSNSIGVTILPACMSKGSNNSYTPTNCSIADFIIDYIDPENGTGQISVTWEDSEQGNDYDKDMIGYIRYELVNDNKEVKITTNITNYAAGHTVGFGFSLGGTTDDGVHFMNGINFFQYDEDGATDGVEDCNGAEEFEKYRNNWGEWRTQTGIGCGWDPVNPEDFVRERTFTIDTSPATSPQVLESPLWYATKYGGFNDIDDDKNPNESSTDEWDYRQLDGSYGSDGYPDNYFPVFNPSNLEDRMSQVFAAILNRVSAGNAAAVVSKTSTGIGAIYQAIYQPLIKKGEAEVQWTGYLHGIFIDSNGLLREDHDKDGLLDDYATDPIIEIFFNEADDQTQIQRYASSDGITKTADGDPLSLHQLEPIWSAQEVMSELSDSGIKANRTYDPTLTVNGRYMYTWIDNPGSTGVVGEVDDGEVVPFIASTFGTGSDNYRYLNHAVPDDGVDDGDDAGDIVNFVRGVTGITGQRNRVIDYDSDGTVEKIRLGDIIHSTPVAVGAPKDGYNTVYNDDTYRDFVKHYFYRRQVIYVGGNDGVLHAFNSGFWDSSQHGFVKDLANSSDGLPLGAELWGYVPMNLLPHLKWLPEVDYPHVYYMDGEPLVFDAKIFDDDEDHPHRWGTVLVAGMRLGGAEIELDINDDSTFGSSGDITTRSAYVVMDITNPEKPPTLIAEISDDNMKLTIGRPDIISFRQPSSATPGDYNTGTNEWYLAFGSGPDDLTNVESTQTARVFIWDLINKTFVSGFNGNANGAAIGFTGDFTTIDWDLDGNDDTVYFGTDETDVANPTVDSDGDGTPDGALGGRLQRIALDSTNIASSSISTIIDTDQVFLNKPLTVRENRNRWVFAGSGRLFTTDDVVTTAQESFYGVKDDDAYPGATYDTSDLQNVTGIDVFTAGHIYDNDNVLTGEPTSSDDDYYKGYSWLEKEIEDIDGWYYNMDVVNTATRNMGNAVSVNKLLAYTLYTPTEDLCNNIGTTALRISCLTTGTACPFDVLGVDENDTYGDRAIDEVHFVNGLVTDISIHYDGSGNPQVIGHGQHGDIHRQAFQLPPLFFGRQSWREIIDY